MSDGQLVLAHEPMARELDSFASIARPFLEAEAPEIIKQAASVLRTIAQGPSNRVHRWEVAPARPIRTIVSTGDYQRGGQGAHSVRGVLTFVWEIRNVWKRPGQKRRHEGHRHFQIVGNASVRAEVLELPEPESRLAMWRFELGCADSPGCFFHSQVLGDTTKEELAVFPSSLDVPRLPTILVSPMDALEFVLSELFQNRWARHVTQLNSPHLEWWRSCQRKRLKAVLNWKRQVVEDAGGSPWSVLKSAKPQEDLLQDL